MTTFTTPRLQEETSLLAGSRLVNAHNLEVSPEPATGPAGSLTTFRPDPLRSVTDEPATRRQALPQT